MNDDATTQTQLAIPRTGLAKYGEIGLGDGSGGVDWNTEDAFAGRLGADDTATSTSMPAFSTVQAGLDAVRQIYSISPSGGTLSVSGGIDVSADSSFSQNITFGMPEAVRDSLAAFPTATAVVRHSNGSSTAYQAASDTSAAAGTAIISAQTAASSGDSVFVYRSATISTSLGKDGVDWYLLDGVTIENDSSPVFSDGGNAMSFSIDGNGSIVCSSTVTAQKSAVQIGHVDSVVIIRANRIVSEDGVGILAQEGECYIYANSIESSDGSIDCAGSPFVYVSAYSITSGNIALENDGGDIRADVRFIESTATNAVENVTGSTIVFNSVIKAPPTKYPVSCNSGSVSLYGCILDSSESDAVEIGGGSIYISSTSRLDGAYITANGSGIVRLSDSAVGSSSSVTDDSVARFDGTGGRQLQSSGVTIDDSGNISTSGDLSVTSGAITVGDSSGVPAVIVTDTTATTPAENIVVNKQGGNMRAIYATYSDTGTHVPRFLIRHARGTIASPASLQNGDQTGAFWFNSYDSTLLPGTPWRNTAVIASFAESNGGADGSMKFYTNNTGTSTLALTIDKTQDLYATQDLNIEVNLDVNGNADIAGSTVVGEDAWQMRPAATAFGPLTSGWFISGPSLAAATNGATGSFGVPDLLPGTVVTKVRVRWYAESTNSFAFVLRKVDTNTATNSAWTTVDSWTLNGATAWTTTDTTLASPLTIESGYAYRLDVTVTRVAASTLYIPAIGYFTTSRRQ